ncbi:MAG: hypothetical protein ACLVH8_10150 [Fusobacterium sp.]
MNKDLFFEILENNPRLNEYDLQQIIAVIEDAVDENILDEYYLDDIEFFQNLIDFMEGNSYEILNIKRLKEFIEENL